MKVDVLADLESLLYHYDEVQLPNLGVISTRQNDFSIDRGQGLIFPSAKKVHSFDRIINTNNNALINFIAHKYGMSYEDAQQTIQDFSDEYAETLTNKGLSIPSVGDLSMDENGRVIFQPNQLNNYSIENYGLPTLKNIHPILFEKSKPEETTSSNDTKTTTKAVATIKKLTPVPSKTYSTIFLENRLLQMMVIVALLLVTSIPLIKRYTAAPNNNQANIINIPSSPSTNNSIENTNTNTYNPDHNDQDGYLPSKQKESTIVTPPKEEEIKEEVVKVEPKEEETPKPPKEENIITADNHLIVLGAFGSKANAEKLQLNIYSKGYKDANITKLSNGYYRVGILLDCPKSEVNAKLQEIKKDFKSAYWKK